MSSDYSENKKATTPKKKSKNIIDWDEKLCRMVLDEWDKGRQYVSDLDDLYEELYQMLRGKRPQKNYDWQSNLVINKVFQVVWTAIPYIVQKVFGASPIIGVRSYDKKGAWQREQLIEFWNTMQLSNNSPHIPYFLVVVMASLRAMLNGVSYVKKTWHQNLKTSITNVQIPIPMQADENGNEIEVEPYNIELKDTTPIEDFPLNIPVNNKDIVVDWLLQPAQSCRQGRFVIHRTLTDLQEMYDSGLYYNLDKIDATISGSSTLAEDHNTLKGMDGQEEIPTSDIYAEVEIFERVGKLPVIQDKNGGYQYVYDKEEIYGEDTKVEMKHMVVTVAKCKGTESEHSYLIRFEPNNYNEINYIDTHIFFDSERHQSIGMVEPIKDTQTAINDNINAAFDEIWQNLMPPVIVNQYALWEWDTMQYAPAQKWLVGGNPNESIYFKEPSNITRDAWQKHALLDNEIQLTTVTNAMQGLAQSKTATTNVMNAQMTAGKLDFLVKMFEKTMLIPSAQMDMRFVSKFAHPKTVITILGENPKFSKEDFYRYIPAAASVKMEHQKEIEIQQDIQLMQIVAQMQNPNVPKILNTIWGNILRNRDMPKEAAMFDEDFFEPQSDAGNLNMMQRMLQGGMPNNQNQLPMSGQEQSVRRLAIDRTTSGRMY